MSLLNDGGLIGGLCGIIGYLCGWWWGRRCQQAEAQKWWDLYAQNRADDGTDWMG